MYLPGCPEGSLGANGRDLNSAAVTAWQTALDSFSAGVNSTGYQLGWVSKPEGEPVDFRPADEHEIRERIGTQRRRVLP